MPNFDRTGPQGKGAKTGGQKGKCSNTSDDNNLTEERGFGRGRNRGFGNRNRNRNEGGRGRRGRGLGRFFGKQD